MIICNAYLAYIQLYTVQIQYTRILSDPVQVRYVDSGDVENIPVVHVYPMLLCEEVPQLCVPCQLYGLIPVSVFGCEGV